MKINKMRHLMLVGLLFLGGCAATGKPMVFVVGDYAYVNGQKVPLEQYKQMKANGTLEQFTTMRGPAPLAGAPAPQPGTLPPAGAPTAMPLPAGAARTAICRTMHLYDEFPADDEKFSCTSGLGELTRPEIISRGWKIDLTEKLPAPGNPLSPRGMPLAAYKLVISR